MELFNGLFESMNWWQLLLISFVMSFTLFFSMREFLSWYLKVHDLKSELQSLNSRIDDLESLLRGQESASDEKKDDSIEPPIEFNSKEKPTVNHFPIDH